jgi:uncharacterized repeat protein (TIGR03943 family)
MNKAAQGVVLLLVGGAVLRSSLTDLYLRYVKEGLRPFLIVAGVALVVIAIGTLIPEFLRRDEAKEPEPVCCDAGAVGHAGEHTGPSPAAVSADAHDDHGGHKEPGVSWLMILPVLALLLVAPPALGSDAASRSGTALGTGETTDFPPLPKGDPAKISVLDYASRAVFEKGASLKQRRVELSGFVMLDKQGRQYVARMILSCCAADARPIKVVLQGDVPQFSQGTWVRLVGTYSKQVVKDKINGETIPYVNVESIKRIKTPKKQYE